MRRGVLLLMLLLGAEGLAAAPLGKLVLKKQQVYGTLPSRPAVELEEGKSEAVDGLLVETWKKSAAKFALGRATASLTVGPESRFTFRPGLFSPEGELAGFDFFIEWGKFRWAAVPKLAGEAPQTELGAAPHQVHMETPAGKVDLYGTDVYIMVDRASGATAVYVAEGAAELTSAGGTVRVEEGSWTSMTAGAPPLQPIPLDPSVWALSPEAGGPAFRLGPDLLIGDPLLDLRDPRLELPK
jgi:hypothetical protein